MLNEIDTNKVLNYLKFDCDYERWEAPWTDGTLLNMYIEDITGVNIEFEDMKNLALLADWRVEEVDVSDVMNIETETIFIAPYSTITTEEIKEQILAEC